VSQHFEALGNQVIDRSPSRWIHGASVPEKVVADDPAFDGQGVDHQIPHMEVQPYPMHQNERRASRT
jgi:hypothetical protein